MKAWTVPAALPAAHRLYRCAFVLLLAPLLIVAVLLQSSPARAQASEDGLLRLAAILGSVHHLRYVCGTGEGGLWRNKMSEFLDVEEDPEFRKLLISHFNDAYYQMQRDYPDCSPDAARYADNLLREGAQLSRNMAAESARDIF